MGTKLPDGAASGDFAGNRDAIDSWHQQKEAWQRDRVVQGNKTADVLRKTETGGSAIRGEKPTYTPVAGLSGLDVFADEETKLYERKWGGRVEEAQVVFIFYNVTDGVLMNDQIEFEDDKYAVMEVNYEPQSGRIEVLASLNRSSV